MKKGKRKTITASAKENVIIQSVPLEANASADGGGNVGTRPTPTRRNVSALIDRNNRFTNIDNGLVPYHYSSSITNKSNVDIRDAVVLCQKAYYNFWQFRNVIDLMTEFSVSNIYLQSSNKKATTFFEALFKKINLRELQDKFFREYYRSGNVFIYRFDAKLEDDAITKISQTFGSEIQASVFLPARYIIMNPADIQISGGAAFVYGRFFKIMTDYEVEALRNPRTDEDKEVFDSLPKDVKELIKSRKTNIVLLELDPKRLYAVFYKKQDYEPFSVPMGFPVLDDINWKAEMKKMDMSITRTMQQAILLITLGAKPEDGGINQAAIQAMQKIFQNESIGRVLVADYTTEAKFVIPEIADLLDPKKYEIVDRDIQLGMNNILIGDDKFANQSIKVQVFIERLKQGRMAFLNNFLIPEIRRLSKYLGFKSCPIPIFEEIDLKDGVEYSKMITQLITMGVLTPEEGLQAMESGRLPTPEESVESQTKFKEYKDDGLYQPLVGGPADQLNLAKETGDMKLQQQSLKQQPGRPTGTKSPQSTKKISPIGASQQLFSLSKVTENILLAQSIQSKIESKLLKKFKLKKLNEEQKNVAEQILAVIISNENPKDWENKINDYLKNPIDTNENRISEIQDIALKHQVDNYLASILYSSKKE